MPGTVKLTTYRADIGSVTPPAISVTELFVGSDGASPDAEADLRPVTGRSLAGTATRRRQKVLEWVVILAVGLCVAVVVRTSVLQAFYIPSESMVPTFEINDRVVVDKISYRVGDVHRGSIVVFERPTRTAGAIKDLVKRVIAVGGDTVEARNGVVYVNDSAVPEPYLRAPASTQNLAKTTIPNHFLWVMGDNRMNSADSRVFGPIPVGSVVGRVVLRAWPPTRVGFP